MTSDQQTQGIPEPTPAARLTRPFREFARLQSSGSIVLLVAAVAAIAWSNSPWSASYGDLWHKTALSVGLGDFSLSMPLEMWINDLVMALFFLLVGLEIKREFLVGELNSTRKAILPVAAAAGGMLVPGLIVSFRGACTAVFFEGGRFGLGSAAIRRGRHP